MRKGGKYPRWIACCVREKAPEIFPEPTTPEELLELWGKQGRVQEQSAALFEEANSIEGAGWALFNVGSAARRLGEYERAVEMCARGREIFQAIAIYVADSKLRPFSRKHFWDQWLYIKIDELIFLMPRGRIKNF